MGVGRHSADKMRTKCSPAVDVANNALLGVGLGLGLGLGFGLENKERLKEDQRHY